MFLKDFGEIPEDNCPVALYRLSRFSFGTICLHAGQTCSNTSKAGTGGQNIYHVISAVKSHRVITDIDISFFFHQHSIVLFYNQCILQLIFLF